MATIPFLQGQSGKLAKLTIISTPTSKGGFGSGFLKSLGSSIISGGLTNGLSTILGNVPLVYEVMYNPDKYSLSYGLENITKQDTDKNEKPVETKFITNRKVSFQLILDATGASPSNSFYGKSVTNTIASATKGVELLVAPLLAGLTGFNKETHDTNVCVLIWGTFLFVGRAESATVNYQLFDRLGRPLRATVDVSFVKDITGAEKLLDKIKNSPDITKTYTVKAGDTLPLIALREYDDESFYMEIAKINNLKNYRRLEPGMTLVMPPFNKNAEETNA
jgi:LysM repeat protein